MKKSVQSITLILGSLLAVAIICAQLFQFHTASSYTDEDTKTEQHESGQSTSDESLISLPSFSLPSSAHVSLTQEAYCLFEIIFEDAPQNNSSAETPLYPEKLFITLFRVIISPNAP